MDRETLIHVARTSLRTKVHKELADLLTEVRLVRELARYCFRRLGVKGHQLNFKKFKTAAYDYPGG